MRILQLGCGRWGRNILRDLVALRCAVTVVDPDPAARDAAAAAGAAQVLAAYAPTSVDGVVIATPASTHYDELARFLDGSTPVFVEKPLCDRTTHARAILARARCPIQLMDKWRYHPAIRRLAAIARTGELGAVIGLRTRRLQDGHAHTDTDAIWTLAPHDLDIARAILCHIPPLRSVCREGTHAAAGVIALFGDGDAGARTPAASPWFALEVSAMRPRREREVALICSDGVAWLDDPEAMEIHVRRPGAREPTDIVTHPTPGPQPLFAGLRACVEHLRGGPAPAGTLSEAVETVGILAALHGEGER
ncbi:MAG: Gfo/Idh/MocA family oxidoreductase [Planctomycetes bacterium]|nr:Gfo/Idh/MocA family oxidoreductase [Planctomycetota bacterium]